MTKATCAVLCIGALGGGFARAQSSPEQPYNYRAPQSAAIGSGGMSREPSRQASAGSMNHACSASWTSAQSFNAVDAWQKGKDLAGDGKFGEALVWYCRSAAAGNANAAYEIGELFNTGYQLPSTHDGANIRSNFVPADRAEAFYWYKMAADRGYTRAMSKVAVFYVLGDEKMKGSGVTKNTAEAVRWTIKAADKGDTVAQGSLAQAYGQGGVVQKDPKQSDVWLAKAVARKAAFEPKCNRPYMVAQMTVQLPLSGGRRGIKKINVGEVIAVQVS